MTIRDYIMLSALLFVCGTAGAQDLKWSDFTVTDTLSSPSALLFRWDAKKTTVTKDKIKYRYTSIQSNLVSAMIRPECQTTEELLHCQTLADFSRAWALALQDSLISVTNKADKVVSDYKARYLKGLELPIQQETPFDITSLRFWDAGNGGNFGLGCTTVLPLGGLRKLVFPITCLNLSIGGVLKEDQVEFNIVAGKGRVKEWYFYVYGPDRKKQVPYLNLSVNYYYHLLDTGKNRLFACGGAGYSIAQFSRFHKDFLNVPVKGISLSGGISYEHRLGSVYYDMAWNHSERQSRYLRLRFYSDQILTKTAWIPTLNVSVSFISLTRNVIKPSTK